MVRFVCKIARSTKIYIRYNNLRSRKLQYQQPLEVSDKPAYTVHRIVDVQLDHFAQ